MKKFFERITGIAKLREEAAVAAQKAIAEAEEAARKSLEVAAAAQKAAEDATNAAEEAYQNEKLAKMTPKDRATAKKEPWVEVIETRVNKDNVRNGFFELDWNDLFIEKLRREGYGLEGDKDEEIIDRWFRELCAGVVVDGDFGGTIGAAGSVIEELKKDEGLD